MQAESRAAAQVSQLRAELECDSTAVLEELRATARAKADEMVRLEAVRLNTGEVLAQRIVVETMAGAAEGAAGHASPRARQAGFGRAPGGNAGCQP